MHNELSLKLLHGHLDRFGSHLTQGSKNASSGLRNRSENEAAFDRHHPGSESEAKTIN